MYASWNIYRMYKAKFCEFRDPQCYPSLFLPNSRTTDSLFIPWVDWNVSVKWLRMNNRNNIYVLLGISVILVIRSHQSQIKFIDVQTHNANTSHDDVIKWKHFLRYWSFVTGDRWIPLAKGSDAELWCFLCGASTSVWASNRDASDLRRHRAHHDVTVMENYRCNKITS